MPKTDLCRGPQQVIIVPDESQFDVEEEGWKRVAERVSFAQIELLGQSYKYCYRHLASIALAEVSRQVGICFNTSLTRCHPGIELATSKSTSLLST